MNGLLRPALSLLALMTVVTGLVYPMLINGLASMAFAGAAGGTIIERDGKPVGDLTSAGYGHTIGASVGLGYMKRDDGQAIDAAWLEAGKVEVDLAGVRLAANVSLRPPYDPSGSRTKG